MRLATPSSAIAFALLLFSATFLFSSARADPPANPEAAKLHALFDEEWEWTLKEFPEFATSVGDNRYNDKLTDLSVLAMERRKAHERLHHAPAPGAEKTGQGVVEPDVEEEELWHTARTCLLC